MKQGVAMKRSVRLYLNIAGDRIEVLFDGDMVSTPHFPDIPCEYTAPCGTRITQDMLVLICAKKLKAL